MQKKLKEQKRPHTIGVRKQHNAQFRRYLDFETLKSLFSGDPSTNTDSKDDLQLSPELSKRDIRRRKSKSVDLDQFMMGDSNDIGDYESVPDTNLSMLSKEIRSLSDSYESVPPCSIILNKGVVEVKTASLDSVKPANELYESAPATKLSLRTGHAKAHSLDDYESVPVVHFELGMLGRETDIVETDSAGSTPPTSLDLGMLSRLPNEESSGLSSSKSCVSLSKYRNSQQNSASSPLVGANQDRRKIQKSVSLSSEVHDKRTHASVLVTQLVRQFESNQYQEGRSERLHFTQSTDSLSPITPEHSKLMKTHSDCSRGGGDSHSTPKSLSLDYSGSGVVTSGPKSLSEHSGSASASPPKLLSIDYSRGGSASGPKSFSFDDSGHFTASWTPLSPKNSLESTYESISGYESVFLPQGKLLSLPPPTSPSSLI